MLLESIHALLRREVSSVELTTRSLERSARLQTSVNAFTSIETEAALARAAWADEQLAKGVVLGPLHGVPIAYKDMFDRAGRRCSFGSRMPQVSPPGASAPVLARLEAAGAVIVGALNMSEFALGPTGHNAAFGHCRNPWDTRRITGGSSSGAAAAVAAGMVLGAIGTDTGGSIRLPAACCGVVGLMPTQARVSLSGVQPCASSLDRVGPLARTVQDCRLLFQVMAEADSTPASAVLGSVPRKLLYPTLPLQIAPEIREAMDRAAALFVSLGIEVTPTTLPAIDELHDLADTIQKTEVFAAHRTRLEHSRAAFTPHVLRRIEAGEHVTALEYQRALQQRPEHLQRFLARTMLDGDALLLPALAFPVPGIDETDEERNGPLSALVRNMTRLTRWLNYLGVPALCLPCGVDGNNMPIGMQLVGRPCDEATLLELGQLFQSNSIHHERTFGT
jgi:aspartyl-tRNA(Asn)/glutamyl-tRNA(Gln) amidotransferase subunit A